MPLEVHGFEIAGRAALWVDREKKVPFPVLEISIFFLLLLNRSRRRNQAAVAASAVADAVGAGLGSEYSFFVPCETCRSSNPIQWTVCHKPLLQQESRGRQIRETSPWQTAASKSAASTGRRRLHRDWSRMFHDPLTRRGFRTATAAAGSVGGAASLIHQISSYQMPGGASGGGDFWLPASSSTGLAVEEFSIESIKHLSTMTG
jgi:hypothetical protein